MSLDGKDVVIKVSTGGTLTAVDELNSFTMSNSGGPIDVTHFGDDWRQRIYGIGDVTYSVGGFWDPDDTNGQVKIKDSLINNTDLYITVLPDGSTGFKQLVRVNSFDIGASVDGAVTFSAELVGASTFGAST